MDKRKLEESPLKLEMGEPITVISQRRKLFKPESTIATQESLSEDVFNLAGFDEEIFEEIYEKINMKLDLSSTKRCIIKSIEKEHNSFDVILDLKDEITKATAICRLKPPWNFTKLEINIVASVQANWNESQQVYQVTADSGHIITSPDFLVSGTSVVGSLFCKRKGVLSDRFRGIDTDSKIMNIGSIVHEMLQTALRRKVESLEDIKKICDEILRKPQTVFSLYSCKTSEPQVRKDINPFVTKIHKFIQRYVLGDYKVQVEEPAEANKQYKQFEGQIDEVKDIEENIWSPRLGLKGKIDVSVQVRSRNKFFNSNVKLMPLELKTGKASFSLEHKGQLILYQIMMQDMGKKVDSGLLFYLREGLMSEVTANRHEKRDLLMLRNELSHFLNRNLLEDLGNQTYYPQLPEPINHPTACGKCPYSTLCCTFLKFEKKIEMSDGHPIKTLSREVLTHLQESHFEYFLHWINLISLENQELQKQNQLKMLWTKSPEERFKAGKDTLINLKVVGNVSNEDDSFVHVFSPQTKEGVVDFTTGNFSVGDYLIVSTDKRIAVAAGRVINVAMDTMTLSLERNLQEMFFDQQFHLDRYESQTQMVFNLTNIGVLLENRESAERLRKIIIERSMPVFSKSLPDTIMKSGQQILASLNKPQRQAVLQALACENYMLLKGLPGTGKTQTLVALVQLLLLLNKTVLITCHTHSAVDNILVRLMAKKLKFLRLGSVSRIHPALRAYSENTITANCKTPQELEAVYNHFQIVAVTCLGSAHPLITQKLFDVCLVDEATQIMQCTIVRPLLSAKKFILVGDPEQLPPVVKSLDAKKLGAAESLFKRLDCEAATRVLDLQYRMNRTITKLANGLTYNGALKCANEGIEKATIQIPNPELLAEDLSVEKWLNKTLSNHIEQSCILLNTGNAFNISTNFRCEEKNGINKGNKSSLYVNYCEIAIVVHLVQALLKSGVNSSSIGVIAPYRAQVESLKDAIERCSNNYKVDIPIEVNTVDQYQGRDKNIIIYSCTKSDEPSNEQKITHEAEILEDRRRLTVAITRSKNKLIILGDVDCLNRYTPFRDLFQKIGGLSKISLVEGKLGFSYNSLMSKLHYILDT